MLEMENMQGEVVDAAEVAKEEVKVLQVNELVWRLNTERLRVAMLLADVRADRLERALRLAMPEIDENGEYTNASIAAEVALVLKEFPELCRQEMQIVPRVGAMGGSVQAVDQIAEIFGGKQ